MYNVNGGAIGVSDKVVFFTTRTDLSEQEAHGLGPEDKRMLGEQARLIDKEKIAEMLVLQDSQFTTVIVAKGLGDDIGVHALNQATQQALVAAVLALKGQPGTTSEKTAGLFARSGKFIVLALCSALITYLLHFIVITLNGQSPAQAQLGKQGMLYSLADFLGPAGTWLIGGTMTLLLLFKAFKNSKNRYSIIRYKF